MINLLTKFAREQRKSKNPWEHKLWQRLRGHRFLGLQFKRQVPIDNYIVDFCCRRKMLIIELDGGQHSQLEISQADWKKQRYLENLGYKVLRFWNNELEANLEGVLEIVRKATR